MLTKTQFLVLFSLFASASALKYNLTPEIQKEVDAAFAKVGGVGVWARNAEGKLKSATEYYSGIDASATDVELKQQLHDLINPHVVFSYDAAWEAFMQIDKYLPNYPCDSNKDHIPDVYSNFCWSDAKADGGECGNYKKEGDCFNREHIWPKSWFGGFDNGKNAQSDFFELWPSDGYVNGLRGNYPFGTVNRNSVSYNSTNGSLIGTCQVDGYSGKCFEPSDEYKGDFARAYFYLSVAYYKVWDCCDDEAVNKWDIKPWEETLLKQWHANDPVNDFERQRNEVIYQDWQQNRNPFIDHPEWVSQISDF